MKLDPQANQKSGDELLLNFDWTDSTLDHETKGSIEDLLVQFNVIFPRHWLYNGINKDFKFELTPIDDRAANSRSIPAPLKLKEGMVELVLLDKYGIITILPFSKYASSIFAQRKPHGKLRLLVDLRKINNLMSDDYINKNQPVSTLVDAAQDMAGKKRTFLQVGLFADVSLLTNCRSNTNRDAAI